MGNQFLSLSLFIMLLSFFIVLNAMSDFDLSKSQPVLNSLTMAFSQKEEKDPLQPSFVEDPSQAFRQGDALDQLDGLFRSKIAGVEIARNRLGTEMQIKMPVEEFEKYIFISSASQDAEAGTSGVSEEFAPVLVSILDTEDGIKYRMDMILNTSDTPAVVLDDTPQTMRNQSMQVARYAQRLEQAGLPKKLVTAGLGEGEQGQVQLFFRRYVPFNPLGDGSSEGGEG